MGMNEEVPHEHPSAGQTLEDPLTAALPPSTDFITYLTILEYNLTPKNLPTLNKLLQQDDGTLAAEIGWDLLKLVLPILRVEPEHAKECLDIVARRGNPKEVVVRVAEELEALGQEESDEETDPSTRDDGLPTSAGAVPHVHLGNMSLDGMPRIPAVDAETADGEYSENMPNSAIEDLKLQALLSMLGLLHPRIKTQYPSRFLATSLPAALSAYRRLSKNADSTSAFLQALTKLSGRRRPALPPRVSTSNTLTSTKTSNSATDTVISAPLPDPESKKEEDSINASKVISANEVAINQRLVQAVLLEIVEEYTIGSSEAQPPLTGRLRAQIESQSITSSRKAELEELATSEEATTADILRGRFVTVGKDLKLDIQQELAQLIKSRSIEPQAEEEEQNEYPTKPSQIPISTTSLLLLHAYGLFELAKAETSQKLSLQAMLNSVLPLIVQQYNFDSRLRQSAPALDALLSIIYLALCTPSSPTSSATIDTRLSIDLFTILSDIFTTCPDPEIRDNSYHLATHLFHGHCSRSTRVQILKDLLDTSDSNTQAASPMQDAQSGNLKAIAIDWLKNELCPTPAVREMMSRLSGEERGLSMTTLKDLANLVMPLENVPGAPSLSETSAQEATEALSADLPFHIASLNLLGLIGRSHEHIEPSTDILLARGEALLSKLEKWKDYLTRGLEKGSGEVNGISVTDVFALEDAVVRCREVLPYDDD